MPQNTEFPTQQTRTARFAGSVALVTGAGTGIGAATCHRLVEEGARVILTGRREAPLRKVADALGSAATVLPADAADTTAMRQVVATAVDTFGRLDVVVANAGGHKMGRAGEVDDDMWRFNLRTNLDTAFVTIREALHALCRSRGSVVVVSSLAGRFAGPDVVGYATTKHGLIGLTRSLARDYGRDGVRVNAICPGWVRTEMADEQMDDLAHIRNLADREDAYALATENTPLGRPADAAEIASAIAFLASSDASVITGTTLFADAGASCVDLPTIAFAR